MIQKVMSVAATFFTPAWPLLLQVLSHLTKKRPANCNREEIYLQAEAFAVLVDMALVHIDGERGGSLSIAYNTSGWGHTGRLQSNCNGAKAMRSQRVGRGQEEEKGRLERGWQ
jgi:hypothetical protein